MNHIKIFRLRTGITQEALAGYLGVSRSLIYHAENETRSLPQDVSAKLDQLIIKFTLQEQQFKAADQKPVVDKKKIKILLQSVKRKSAACKQEIHINKKRLTVTQKKLQSATGGLNLISIMSNDKDAEYLEPWMNKVKKDTVSSQHKNDLHKQIMLQLNIDLLKAKAKVYDDFIKKYDAENSWQKK